MRVIVAIAAMLAVAAQARPQHQQAVALPPHLLRQYLAQRQQQQQQEGAPIYEQQSQQTYAQPQPSRAPIAVKEQQPQYVQYIQPQQQQVYRPKLQAKPVLKGQQDDLPEDYDPNPSYEFGFDVNDDQYTNYQNRKEERQGDVIKGSYSVVDSDGFIRTVTYTADPKEGFKAEVVRKPTDIVVKIPTPPPATLEHQLRQHQYAQSSPVAVARPQQHQQQQQPQYYRYQQQ